MRILTLDLGTQSGWALKDRDGTIISGTISFKPGRHEGGGMKFLRFKQWLNTIGNIDAVYYEEVNRHVGTIATHTYGAFHGHLTAWCEERKIPYQGVPVGTIKKAATGKGSANKEAMIEAAKSKGHNPADDNEADAICLLYYVLKLDEAA